VNWFKQDILLSCGHLVRGEWVAVMTVGKTLFCEFCTDHRMVEDVDILGVSSSSPSNEGFLWISITPQHQLAGDSQIESPTLGPHMKPTLSASKRTKNRFKEHTLAIHPSRRSTQIDGQAHIMLRCTDFGCSWFGWIPKDEIDEE
jgi:hypothetical protein